MRIFLLFVIIVIVLPWLQIKKNREKVAAYIQTHPELMRFFRPPGVYIVIMSIILLYAFGGIILVIVGGYLAWWVSTHPTLKQRLRERKDLVTTLIPKKTSAGIASPKYASSVSSSSFISSSSPMDISVLKKAFFWLIGIILVLFVLSKGLPWYTVNPGEVALITRLGKLQENYYTEGLNFKIPLIDKVVRINIQTQKVEATANAASKDLQNISATIAVNGNIEAGSVKQIYRELGDASLVDQKIISPSIQESVKAATAKYTAEELITKRTLVSQEIKTSLVEKLQKRGIRVSDVNIVNFQFSADFDAAIEKKVKAEQEALAEKNKLESVKFQAQQKIEQAKAEAESIRIQAEAIKSQGGAEYVNLKWIERWDGKLPSTMLGEGNNMLFNLK